MPEETGRALTGANVTDRSKSVATLSRQRLQRFLHDKRELVLMFLVAALALLCGAFPPRGITVGIDSFGAIFMMGVAIIQPVLFGMWSGLSTLSFARRFFGGLIALATVALGVALGTSSDLLEDSWAVFVASLLPTSLLLLFTVAVFSPIRRILGWRLRHVATTEECGSISRGQFNVGDLLFCTAMVAVLLTLGKLALQPPPGTAATFAVLSIVLPALALTPAIVIAWGALAFRHRKRRWIVVVPVACISCLAAVCVLAGLARIAVGVVEAGEVLMVILCIQAGASAAGFVVALVLRACGYRIARNASDAKAAEE